jgi:hypothetical protein
MALGERMRELAAQGGELLHLAILAVLSSCVNRTCTVARLLKD